MQLIYKFGLPQGSRIVNVNEMFVFCLISKNLIDQALPDFANRGGPNLLNSLKIIKKHESYFKCALTTLRKLELFNLLKFIKRNSIYNFADLEKHDLLNSVEFKTTQTFYQSLQFGSPEEA